jgi:hypothetical protein
MSRSPSPWLVIRNVSIHHFLKLILTATILNINFVNFLSKGDVHEKIYHTHSFRIVSSINLLSCS